MRVRGEGTRTECTSKRGVRGACAGMESHSGARRAAHRLLRPLFRPAYPGGLWWSATRPPDGGFEPCARHTWQFPELLRERGRSLGPSWLAAGFRPPLLSAYPFHRRRWPAKKRTTQIEMESRVGVSTPQRINNRKQNVPFPVSCPSPHLGSFQPRRNACLPAARAGTASR